LNNNSTLYAAQLMQLKYAKKVLTVVLPALINVVQGCRLRR